MNSKNSKIREPHRFRLDLTDKLTQFEISYKKMALINLSIY